MRTQPVNHQKHERLAVVGFILTLLIAAAAFYYVWQSNVQIGQSIAGTQALGEIMFKRQQMQQMMSAEHPGIVQDFQAKNGCCIYIQSPELGSQIKYDVKQGSPGLCTDNLDRITKERIKTKALVVVDIEAKECQKNIIS